MKSTLTNIFLLIIVLPFLSTAQISDKKKVKLDKKNLEFYNNVTKGDEKIFDITTVPEEYKLESYVVLAAKTYITIDEDRKSRSYIRKRILLQDENAVKEFAEFYFQKSETTILFIVKKNGSEIEIDLKDAVAVNTEVPKIYRYRFQSEQSYKLAIPNLEVGDIIDYISIFNQEFQYTFTYSDIIGEDVAVLNNSVVLDLHETWSVFRNTFNTPIKFVDKKHTGFDILGKAVTNSNRFILNTGSTNPLKYEPWEDIVKTKPLVKFMAIKKGSAIFANKENKSIIGNKLPIEEILRQYYQYLEDDMYLKSYRKSMYAQFRSYDDKEKLSDEELADLAYYMLRHYAFLYQYPESAIDYSKNSKYTYEDIYSGSSHSMEDKYFLVSLAYMLKKRDFEVLVVAVVPKSKGSLDNIVNFNELTFGIYLPSLNKYYWAPSKDRTHNELPNDLIDGAIGIAISEEAILKNLKSLEDVNIEAVSLNDSKDENVINVSISVSDMKSSISKSSKYYGPLKFRNNYLLEEFGKESLSDYVSLITDMPYFDDLAFISQLRDFDKNLQKDHKGLFKSFKSKSEANQKKAFENWISSKEYKTELGSFSVSKSGRTSSANVMEVEASFTSEDFAKKLGPNIIISAGSLIESQYHIEDKDKLERKSAIDFGYHRKYEYDITIKIPDGYFVDGVDKLNKSVINDYITFTSNAQLVGSEIKIKTLKEYKVIYAPTTAWNDIVAGIDEAYKFSQEKLILKKR